MSQPSVRQTKCETCKKDTSDNMCQVCRWAFFCCDTCKRKGEEEHAKTCKPYVEKTGYVLYCYNKQTRQKIKCRQTHADGIEKLKEMYNLQSLSVDEVLTHGMRLPDNNCQWIVEKIMF
jgi:hypothetical protein